MRDPRVSLFQVKPQGHSLHYYFYYYIIPRQVKICCQNQRPNACQLPIRSTYKKSKKVRVDGSNNLCSDGKFIF